jgi:hypothetical protein
MLLHGQEPKKEATPSAITDPTDALKGISRDVMGDLRPGSRNMVEAAGKASMVTAKNAEGKTGTFKFNVTTIEQFQRPEAPDVTLYRIRSMPDTVRELPSASRAWPWASIFWRSAIRARMRNSPS